MQDAPERAGMTFLDLPQPSIAARSELKFYNGHLLGFKNISKLSGEGFFFGDCKACCKDCCCMDSSGSLTLARAKTLSSTRLCYRPLDEKCL